MANRENDPTGTLSPLSALLSATKAFEITPSDTEEITVTRQIYVGVGGDIHLLLRDDNTPVLVKNAPSGMVYNWKVRQVLADLTTATNLIGLY